MGTMYVLNLSFSTIIIWCFCIITVVAVAILAIKKNKQLEHLVRIIDVMAYVTGGIRSYDIEIVQKANILSLRTLKSAQGDISGRYVGVIKTFDVYDLAKFLYQHKTRINDKEKRQYLIEIIEKNIFEFEAEKLGRMLAELVIYAAKDETNLYKLPDSCELLMNTILRIIEPFEEREIVKLFSEFNRVKYLNLYKDNKLDLADGIKEETAILVRASELTIKAPFQNFLKHYSNISL